MTMTNYGDIVDAVAHVTELSNSDANAAIDAVVASIAATLLAEGIVSIPDLGSFIIEERASRPYRSPRTGQQGMSRPKRVVKFQAAKALLSE